MDDDGLALKQPVGYGVAAPAADGDGEIGIVGQGGPHDSGGETLIPEGVQQPLLAGALVPRALPVRVMEGRELGKDGSGRGFLVRRGRIDEEELLRRPPEQPQVPLDILGGAADPVHHRVEMVIPKRGPGRCGLAGVRLEVV